MTTLEDRSAPGVRIVAVPSPRAPAGDPLDLAGRIISFSYEDSDQKADQMSLQLDNFDLTLFERPELVAGALLEVSWGYPGHMAPRRRVVVTKLKGAQTLTVEGHALSVLMNRTARTRGWTQRRRSDVARVVAAEHGYDGDYVDIEDTVATLDTISQSAETDARLLRRLASREGFVFYVDDAGFHFRKRNHTSAPTHVLTWYGGTRGDLLSFTVESDLVRRVGRAEVRGRDPYAKTTLSATATATSTDRATLGDLIEVVDPELGGTTLQQRNATASVHPTSAPSAAHAHREVDARFRTAERDTIKLSAQAVGDPSLRAKQIIELRGLSSLLSGKYYVSEAKHTVSSSGYPVELKLTKDGVGRRRLASSQVQGRPQGGQPNHLSMPASGALTAVEVIDPETGDTRLQFRRDTQAFGAGDSATARSPQP